MTHTQAKERAEQLFGRVELERRLEIDEEGVELRVIVWRLIHVWDAAAGTYVLRGFGNTWEDAFIDATRYETEEIAYA